MLVDRPLAEGNTIVELAAQLNYSPRLFFRHGYFVKIGRTEKLPDKVSLCSDYLREVP